MKPHSTRRVESRRERGRERERESEKERVRVGEGGVFSTMGY